MAQSVIVMSFEQERKWPRPETQKREGYQK